MQAARSPARVARARVEHEVLDAGAADLLGELREAVEVAVLGADDQRAAVLLGDLGHRLPVRRGGGVDERLVGGRAAGQGRVDRRRVGAHEHQRQAGRGRAGRGHGRGVRGRAAARVLDGEAVERERHADALDGVGADASRHLGEVRGVALDAHDEARLVDEGLLVPEHHRLVADLEGALARADRDELDGRRRRGVQRRLGFFGHVGALGELGALLRQLHGEGEAGREPHSLQFVCGSSL